MNALEHYKLWLPGELKYAATKKGGGYDTRIERARRGDGDRSMYAFLGTEWFSARNSALAGFHHSPDHAKSAQLQYAKFAAGFFDKLGVIHWVKDSAPATPEAFASSAQMAAKVVLDVQPWNLYDSTSFDPLEELKKPFVETDFSSDLLNLQLDLVRLADTANPTIMQVEDVSTQALLIGGRATLCYSYYASKSLTSEQCELPPSQHAA